MPDLDVNALDPIYLDELADYHEVSISEAGVVKARRKNGKWQSGFMGLTHWTEETLAKTHQPGVYTVNVPTPADREQTKKAADLAANEARIAATPNPWSKSSWNLTQQMILADQDPELAARFQREAKG